MSGGVRKSQPTDRPQAAVDPFRVKRAPGGPEKGAGDVAWVAITAVSSGGARAAVQAQGSVAVLAVSVHEAAPSGMNARLDLARRVIARCAHRVAPGQASLWVFPGGYFGYGWRGLDLAALQVGLDAVISDLPANAVLVAGADTGEDDQQVWVARAGAAQADIQTIRRRQTPLQGRSFAVGAVRAAAFVCGEFTGSRTKANGPYHEREFLTDPVVALAGCDVLVDVAHRRVRGSVNGDASPRMVHQLQMERFASRGTAVLVHHHGGERRYGRAKADCASNWIVHRGGEWLSERDVLTVQ